MTQVDGDGQLALMSHGLGCWGRDRFFEIDTHCPS